MIERTIYDKPIYGRSIIDNFLSIENRITCENCNTIMVADMFGEFCSNESCNSIDGKLHLIIEQYNSNSNSKYPSKHPFFESEHLWLD